MTQALAVRRLRSFVLSCVVAADVVVLSTQRPGLARWAQRLAAPRAWVSAVGPDRVAAELARLTLWCVAAWLAIGLLAMACSALPGRLGRSGRRIARVALPAVLRRTIAGSAGLGVLLAPVAGVAGAAVAGMQSPDGSGGRPVAASVSRALPVDPWTSTGTSRFRAQHDTGDPLPGPGWPNLPNPSASRAGQPTPEPTTPEPTTPEAETPGPRTLGPATPGPVWPRSTRPAHTPGAGSAAPTAPVPAATPSAAPSATPHPAPTPSSTPSSTPRPAPSARPRATPSSPQPGSTADPSGETTVRAGDCLWVIAAHRLGGPTDDAEIARYLPELYAANRDVIGDDPDLVRPGQVLHLPAPVAAREKS